MIRNGLLPVILMVAILFQSCFKKDEMITPHPRGDVKTDTIAMTEYYLYQIYFDLDSGKVISSNVKTVSDLGFECSSNGWRIILNTSDFMKVADLGPVQFGLPYDTLGVKLKFDPSDGNPDSTAIGQWFEISGSDTVSGNHVYAISRGLDEFGNPLGLYQVVFDSLKDGKYYFRYAPLQGGVIKQGEVSKDPAVNFIYFSLKTGTVQPLEPVKTAYDLVFTQYTTMLTTDEGIPYPYLVTGVLSNRYQVEVSMDTIHPFQSITRELALGFNYSRKLDAIGYDWKLYDFDSGSYTIRSSYNYVFRNQEGFLFKLRFIGFYNKNGEKGYPVIEYQQL